MARNCILISSELDLHREVLTGALRSLRPHLCIYAAAPTDIDDVPACTEPRLVICNDSMIIQHKRPYAWILLFPEDQHLVRVGIGNTMRTLANATMDDLLVVIDGIWRDDTLTGRSSLI